MLQRGMHLPTAVLAFLLGACTATAIGARASGPQPEPPPTPGAVVHGPDAEVRVSPPGTATITTLLRGTHAFVARLELAPGARVPEHRDATEEYIVVLEGGGTMHIDGVTHSVAAGDAVFMPANARVSFANGDAPMVALQVFAPPGPEAKYETWNVRPR